MTNAEVFTTLVKFASTLCMIAFVLAVWPGSGDQ
jgi:hypothetical protein